MKHNKNISKFNPFAAEDFSKMRNKVVKMV